MADPIIQNAVRAQCIWQAPSGLPEDRFVTTWAFVRDENNVTTEPSQQRDEVAERLREFWLEPTPVASAPVAGLIPASVANLGLEIRCYQLSQAPPREPFVYEFPFTGGATQQVLPREVAITLSFYADRNLPRQRGRVFLGPVAANSMSATPLTTVDTLVRDRIAAAANRLANERGVGDNMQWAVLSQADAAIRPVTAGWVDDAFDTIRKRGAEPTTRKVWPTP